MRKRHNFEPIHWPLAQHFKFSKCDQKFCRNILKSLYLKFETSAHAKPIITRSWAIFYPFLLLQFANITAKINMKIHNKTYSLMYI